MRPALLLLLSVSSLFIACGGSHNRAPSHADASTAKSIEPERICTHAEAHSDGTTAREQYKCRVLMHGFRVVDRTAYDCYANCAIGATRAEEITACSRCGLTERETIDAEARAPSPVGHSAANICDHAQQVTAGAAKLPYRMCLVIYNGLRVYDRPKFDCVAPCLINANKSEEGAACMQTCGLPE